jgi:hypothetical protein
MIIDILIFLNLFFLIVYNIYVIYIKMDLQGLNQNLLDHNSYANSVLEHNQQIQAHNDMVLKTFNDAESSRKTERDVDDIWHGVSDPLKTGFNLMTLASTLGEAKNFEDGVGAYLASTTKGRLGDIYKGGQTLFGSGPEEEEEDDSVLGGRGLGPGPQTQAGIDTNTRLNVFGVGQDGKDAYETLTDAQKATLATHYANPGPQALSHIQGIKDAVQQAGGDVHDIAARALASPPPAVAAAPAAPAAPAGAGAGAKAVAAGAEEEETSTLPTSLEDVVTRTAGAFGVDSAKASVIGNIAGKAGAIGGAVSAVYDQATGQDKTGLEKTAGVLEEVGAGLDMVGTFIPVLEPLGAVVETAGGIASGISDIIQSGKQASQNLQTKQQDTQTAETAQVTAKGAIGGATQLKSQLGGGSYSF